MRSWMSHIEVPRGKVTRHYRSQWIRQNNALQCDQWLLKPEKGRIIFEGQRYYPSLSPQLVQVGDRPHFPDPQVLSSMTVLENIMIGAFNRWGNVYRRMPKPKRWPGEMGLSEPGSMTGRWVLPCGKQRSWNSHVLWQPDLSCSSWTNPWQA